MKKISMFALIFLLMAIISFAEGSKEKKSEDKVWIIATDTEFKPFEYTDINNEFVGIDVDILAAVAEDQGFKYELRPLGWDTSIAAVQLGQADALMAGATITQERIDRGWIFSEGYFLATQTFVVAEESSISGYADLGGKSVGVKDGTVGAEFAESLQDKYGYNIAVYYDSIAMYNDVIRGSIAACVEDTPVIVANIRDKGFKLRIPAGMESDGAPYSFVIMNKDNRRLLDMFNAGLKNIRTSGKYQAILEKYLK